MINVNKTEKCFIQGFFFQKLSVRLNFLFCSLKQNQILAGRSFNLYFSFWFHSPVSKEYLKLCLFSERACYI